MTSKVTALYSRVSTDIQRDKGLSVPRQKEWLEQEVARKNLTRAEHFVDNGYSAASINRPAFSQLLARIADGSVGTVVVYKFDRVARNVRDLLDFVDLLSKHDVSFISLSENLDTTSPTGRLMLTILGSLAEWERSITVERVKDAMYHKADRGDFCGGQPPYGYDVKDKGLVINGAEAKVVRAMYTKFEEIRTLRGLTHWMNKKAYTTKRGQTWAATTVRRVLTSPPYMGYYTYGKRAGGSKVYLPKDKWTVRKGDFTPIITEEQYERVQALVKQRRYIKQHRSGEFYLLSGLMRCTECGGSLCGQCTSKQNGKSFSYYRCHNHISKGPNVCLGVSINKQNLEKVVLEKIQQYANLHFDEHDAEKVLERLKQDKPAEELKGVERNLNKMLGKQKKLLELFEDGAISKDLLVERMDNIAKDLEKLQTLRERLILDVNPKARDKRVTLLRRVKDLKGAFLKLTPRTQREILTELVKVIHVSTKDDIDIELYEL